MKNSFITFFQPIKGAPDAAYVVQDTSEHPIRPESSKPTLEKKSTCTDAKACTVAAPLMTKDDTKTYRVVGVDPKTMNVKPDIVGPLVAPKGTNKDGKDVEDTVHWSPKKPYTNVKVCQVGKDRKKIKCQNAPIKPPMIKFNRPIEKPVTYTVDPSEEPEGFPSDITTEITPSSQPTLCTFPVRLIMLKSNSNPKTIITNCLLYSQ